MIKRGKSNRRYKPYQKRLAGLKSILSAKALIGSNSSLIAPIVIETNSIIGAGSVITKNIPKKSLAIERTDLKILRNKRVK